MTAATMIAVAAAVAALAATAATMIALTLKAKVVVVTRKNMQLVCNTPLQHIRNFVFQIKQKSEHKLPE